jgi:hypothetical protein
VLRETFQTQAGEVILAYVGQAFQPAIGPFFFLGGWKSCLTRLNACSSLNSLDEVPFVTYI